MLLDYPTIGWAEYATCRAKIAAAMCKVSQKTEKKSEIKVALVVFRCGRPDPTLAFGEVAILRVHCAPQDEIIVRQHANRRIDKVRTLS